MCLSMKDGECANEKAVKSYGTHPHVSVCHRVCPHYSGPSRGLGDTIADATKAVGISPCNACQKRRADLNNLIPYGKT